MGISDEAEAALTELAKFGVKGEVYDRGKHLSVEWNYGDGRYRQVFTARTGSDWRGPLNTRARVRRMLREDAIQLPSPSVVIFEKALNLPKPTDFAAEKLRRLEGDVEALADLCLEQTLRIEALEKRLAGLRVTVSFEETVVTSVVPVQAPIQKTWGRSASILQFLDDGRWHAKTDIEKALNISKHTASHALNYLRSTNKVENGQRGMWRKIVQIETAVQQVS